MWFLIRWLARPIAVYLMCKTIEACQHIVLSFLLGLTCLIACIWMIFDIVRSLI